MPAKKPLSPSAAMLLAESRRWTRFLTDETTFVSWQYENQQFDLPVCDESYGGIALLIPADVALDVGQEMVVCYQGAPMRGMVRYVTAYDGDVHRVGLEWAAFKPESGGQA